MAEDSTKPIRRFEVTLKCSEGHCCEKIAKELLNKYLTKDKKHKSCCCKCGKEEKKRDRKCVNNTHKPEAYKKTAVDKRICRDIFCKSHYEKPILLPSSSRVNPHLPPFLPPPNTMYPQPPLLYGYDRMQSYGYPGYGVGW